MFEVKWPVLGRTCIVSQNMSSGGLRCQIQGLYVPFDVGMLDLITGLLDTWQRFCQRGSPMKCGELIAKDLTPCVCSACLVHRSICLIIFI